jgi:hypothetical protein
MQFKGNLITADVTNNRRNLSNSLVCSSSSQYFDSIAVLVFLKLATLLYKNVEKLNAQYGAQY